MLLKLEDAKQTSRAKLGELLRSKGVLWLAHLNEGSVQWSHVGRLITLKAGEDWTCESTCSVEKSQEEGQESQERNDRR